MTAPRQVLPGTTWLITRRCSEQRCFLRPSELVNQIFLFVLAVAARRYGLEVHAFCVMSNHYHLLVTDPHARLPAFVQYLDAFVARAVNAALGRWEGFWSSGTSFSGVSNATPVDIARKAAYVLANPVAAGLVRSGAEWPGLWTGPDQLGQATFATQRPARFFRSKGSTPAWASLTLSVPPGFASAADFQRAVGREMVRLLRRARRKLARRGRTVLGRAGVLAQDPRDRPPGLEPRRNLRPRIAAVNPRERIAAIARLQRFVREHREALKRLRAGIRDVVFPAGTYRMRVDFGACCAGAGSG